MKNLALVVLTYAVILLVGGVIGYTKAGSIASLIASSTFFALLLASSYGMWQYKKLGYFSALALLTFLLAFFGYRFLMTYQAVPAGFMTFLTLIALGWLMRYFKKVK